MSADPHALSRLYRDNLARISAISDRSVQPIPGPVRDGPPRKKEKVLSDRASGSFALHSHHVGRGGRR